MTKIKLKEFQKELKKNRIGLALFFNFDGNSLDPNLIYFSQYTGFGALAVTPSKAFIVVPKAELAMAKRTSLVKVIPAQKKILMTIRKNLKSRPRRIGIDKNRVSLNLYKTIMKEMNSSYVDVAPLCQKLRSAKTPAEIRMLKKACRLTDEIIQKTFWNFKKFRTEAEVSAFLINEVNKLGLAVSFKPIVASGSNACEAHHEPDTKKLKKGFCVIDFGVKYKGYHADMTRTVYIGTPSKREVAMYYKVLDVQMKMIQLCRPGMSFTKIDEKARELFGKEAEHFTHLIGHGIGTEIHENPNPKKRSKMPITDIVENSVITIEPGLYYEKKSGIRIEDDIWVTKKGPVVLTKTGKNLLIIKSRS